MKTAQDRLLAKFLTGRLRFTGSRLVGFISIAMVLCLYLAGVLAPFEAILTDLRFRLLRSDASRSIVLVGIDARSLGELDRWPWPRTHHAALLDRLAAVGVRRVALDIDFSARSTDEADAALAEAIARFPGEVVLPTFAQFDRGRTRGGIVIENEPLPALRRHARLAFANVRQESGEAVVRAFIPGPRAPSFPAVLSGRVDDDGFEIDFGIRPETIPFVSYVDVLAGRIDPEFFAGKVVIVGAVAVELGDMLPVPVHGSLPGPLVIALGYESLIQERAISQLSPLITAAAMALMVLALARWCRRWSWQRSVAATFGAAAAVVGVTIALQGGFALALDSAPFFVALLLLLLHAVIAQVERQALRIFRQSRAVLDRNNIIRAVVEGSFDAILVTDRHGFVAMANRTAEELLGTKATAMIGKSFDVFVHDGAATIEAAVAAGQPVETQILRPDGSTHPVDLVARRTMLPVSNHPLERRTEPRAVTIYTLRDIEQRKRAEEAQRVAHEHVVASDKAKSEFLAAMSHELRTPLNAIIGFSEVLKEQMFGALGNARYIGYAKDIHQSGTHLLEIVNDILDNARVEAGRVKLSETDIALETVVNASVRLVSERANDANLRLEKEVTANLPLLVADERLVKQILVNLLSNAVKFTPAGGSVRISAEEHGDGSLAIAVSDTGIGIPADQVAEVVKPFYQVDRSLARRYEGTGLGLPLVKAFMELHGGQLVIDSAPGAGTTATCLFPAERVRRHRIATAA
jgi:PAS domain S-box-containing protein